MNKEDKLKIVERSIKGTKEYIEEIKENLKNGILHNKEHRKWLKTLLERQEYQLEVFKRELKFLQIQPRTIETLKVGDCLDITINDENVTCYLKIDNIETAKEYLNSLKSYEIHQIIPREFLELWGEINDNIQTAI